MKYKVTIETKVEAENEQDAELKCFDNLGDGNFYLNVEEIKE